MTNWREEYKSEEQAHMVTLDKYAEVGRALGFEGDAWFNDPLAQHEEIVARAASVASLREQLATASEKINEQRQQIENMVELWGLE